MRPSTIDRRSLLLAAAGLAAAPAGFGQAAYPDKPIRMVLPLPVGGFVDTTARMIGEEFLKVSGQPMLIDSKPGGAFQIGAQAAASAPADGYTVFNCNYSIIAAQAALKKLDILNQFTGVCLFGWTSTAIVVAADSPFQTMEDLVAWGRKNPGKLNYAIPGPGSAEHLCSLDVTAGMNATALAFRGAPEMITSTIQKDSHFTVAAVGLLEQYVKKGQLRFLAVMQDKRNPSFPDIPAVSEAGLKVTPFVAWVGLLARKETPPDLVRRLHALFTKTLESPALVARLKGIGMDAATTASAAEFNDIVHKTHDDLLAVVARSGLRFQ